MSEMPAVIRPRILVISTLRLERFVPALGALGAIRACHPEAEIILLTSQVVSAFAQTAPYFDTIWIDDTNQQINPALWHLGKRLEAAGFVRVYDLDATPHTKRLFWVMYGLRALPLSRRSIEWSGAIPGTLLNHDDPRRETMHLVDRWAAQLKLADIGLLHRPDLSWVARQVQSFNVPFRMNAPFTLISATPGPGSSWPADRYGELAVALAASGQIPVLVGADTPPEVCETVANFCPSAVDLTGQATINELVFLAWAATAAVGPDNGITHLTAAGGCRTVVLYNGASDPALVGQRGPKVSILRRGQLSEIPVGEVVATLEARK